MARQFGILIGVGTQLIFFITVWRLFWFLHGPSDGVSGKILWLATGIIDGPSLDARSLPAVFTMGCDIPFT